MEICWTDLLISGYWEKSRWNLLYLLKFFTAVIRAIYKTLVSRKIFQDGRQSNRQSVFSRLNRTCSPLVNEPIVLECDL